MGNGIKTLEMLVITVKNLGGIVAKAKRKPNFIAIFSCFVSCFTWITTLELCLTAYVLLLFLVRKNVAMLPYIFSRYIFVDVIVWKNLLIEK